MRATGLGDESSYTIHRLQLWFKSVDVGQLSVKCLPAVINLGRIESDIPNGLGNIGF